jgi:hypothetical protein
MEEMLINERFKSPNKEFEKVYSLFRKKDYFSEKSQVKRKQEEFVRFLKKGDPMATKVFKQNKENMKSSLSFIEDMVMDYNKKNAFQDFQVFSTAVNDIEMKDSKSASKSADSIKRKIHNNSQKYTMALYSAIRKQKFNNYKDVHKDVDELISKNESVNEAYIVLHSPKKGVKPVATAAYRDKKDAEKWAKDLGGITMIVKKKMRGVDEGKKRFKRQDGIGKAKYTISYHDGKKKHKDGSDFFDIKIFKNKKDLSDFVGTLAKQGYKLTREGINEASIKGRNNKTGEAFGMVIGSDKKNKEGEFEVTIRISYSSRISSYKFMFDKSSNLIAIKDYGYSMDGKFPDMKGGGSVKNIRPNTRETITQIAKITSPAFAKKIVQHVKKVNESVNEGFKSEYKGLDGIVWKKGKSRGGVTNFTPYYKGHDIDKGGHNFKTEKELKDFIKNYILSRDQYHKYKFESVNEAKYKVGDTITVTLKGGKKVIKGKVEKINPLKIRTSPSDTVVLGNHLIKKVVKESVNEGKYNYKADALTAYFKGKIDAKELDKIARDDFKSGIATKKELSNFLSNKFTQDVMSDTYGIPAGTLIKRVRGLMKFAEGKDDGVPQGYNPMVEDKKQIKDLVKKVKHEKLFYDVLATMEKKYGKRQYRIWLEKSLKDFGVNPKHYDYRTNAAAEEKLFQLGK